MGLEALRNGFKGGFKREPWFTLLVHFIDSLYF